MSLIKYVERIKTIHRLIQMQNTGMSTDFARKVGISRSLLMEHLRELREELQAPIVYCRYKKSFYYSKSFNLEIRIINDPLQDPNR
jgi:hypothetical protein